MFVVVGAAVVEAREVLHQDKTSEVGIRDHEDRLVKEVEAVVAVLLEFFVAALNDGACIRGAG